MHAGETMQAKQMTDVTRSEYDFAVTTKGAHRRIKEAFKRQERIFGRLTGTNRRGATLVNNKVATKDSHPP